MIALIQRVTQASVTIAGECVAQTGAGMLALIGVEGADTQASADSLAHKVLTYRVFPDEQGRMNLDLLSCGGELLLVPQFTLAADTRKGRRPGFSRAAAPVQASQLFDYLALQISAQVPNVGLGRFAEDMQVALINDGPATFWLQVD